MSDIQPVPEGAATDEGFWNDQWRAREQTSGIVGFLRRRDHGPNGRFLRLFRSVATPHLAGKSVVELGGGASRFLVDLASAGAEVTAVDYSPVGIQQTRDMFARGGIEGRAIQADIFNPGESLGQYDFVTHWGLAEHFDSPQRLMEVSASLLKDGGLIILTMPNMEAVGALFWRLFAPKNYSAHVYHSSAVMLAAAREAGLEQAMLFHCGPPLLRMAPAERLRPLALIMDGCHAASLLVGRLFPDLFVRGYWRISDTRGFVFRRASHRPDS